MSSLGNNKVHFLYPATIFASTLPYEISTVLGSCVSVCLWDSHLKIGGMNHYMLPLWNGEGLPTPRFGNIATEKLIEKMLYLGSHKKNLTAKIIGGARQLNKGGNIFNVGERNIVHAIEMLKKAEIRIVSQNTGGEKGRKIKYITQTGEIFMKFL